MKSVPIINKKKCIGSYSMIQRSYRPRVCIKISVQAYNVKIISRFQINILSYFTDDDKQQQSFTSAFDDFGECTSRQPHMIKPGRRAHALNHPLSDGTD